MSSRFLIVGPPNVDTEQVRAMLDQLGMDAESDSAESLFPGGPRTGRCRVCGEKRDLTEEHIPPRGAYNKQRVQSVAVEAVIGRDDLDVPDEGQVVQGGVRGHTLCEDCNNLTGRWGREYQVWAGAFMHLLRSQPKLPPEVDEEPGFPAFPEVVLKDVYGGRFVRQVLSMMLTISGSADLGDRIPDLRQLVLGGPPRQLPDPLRLYFLLYGSGNGRFAGGPKGQAWSSSSVLRRVMSIDFPPMAFLLLLEGTEITDLGVDISSLTEWDVDRKSDLRFENLPLGFGNKPWPADYRTKGQMRADADEAEGRL